MLAVIPSNTIQPELSVVSRRATKTVRPTTHEVQAAIEGAVLPSAGDEGKVELLGQWFRMADDIGVMPQLAFAAAARDGIDASDIEGLASMYMLIRDCIADDEWDRFQRHAIDAKAKAEDLMGVVATVVVAHAARPTPPSSGSSTGRRTTSASSKGSSPRGGGPDEDGMVDVATLAGL